MRCLERNKTPFFYSLYIGKEEIIDEYGNSTGEYAVKHGNPKKYMANISAAKGETATRQFGESEEYDKIIVLDQSAPPIDEYSILWVDTMPELNDDGTLKENDQGEVITPHDYTIKKVAKSLNVISVAISKVSVS